MTHLDDNTRIEQPGPRRRPIPPPPRRAPVPAPAVGLDADARVPDSGEGEHSTRWTPDDAAPEPTTLIVRAWVDPVVDEIGHDPRSRYVEHFWLGVLGPTATWLLRRLVAGLDREPEGYEIDLDVTARAMGMSFRPGRSSPFSKALQRCTMFGLAHQTRDGIAVRRRIPVVAQRHLRRMPDAVQRAHDEWIRATIDIDEFTRAHRLALAMLEAGDDATTIEHHLVAIGVADAIAAEVADNACQLR